MNTVKAAKKAAKFIQDPLEALVEHAKPKDFIDEAKRELLPFMDNVHFYPREKELAKQDLAHAREEERLRQMHEQEEKNDHHAILMVKQEYQSFETKTAAEDNAMRKEFIELQTEVAGLAKASGVDTKAHLETPPKKVGVLDIRKLTNIIRFLKFKVETSKDASDLVSQRQNAKRTTGMLAWVSGKQMKIHEQGTMTLQG